MNVKNEAGCWQFELSEGVVTQLRVGYGFCLLLEDGLLIVIEEPFNLSTVTGTVLVPPGERSTRLTPPFPCSIRGPSVLKRQPRASCGSRSSQEPRSTLAPTTATRTGRSLRLMVASGSVFRAVA